MKGSFSTVLVLAAIIGLAYAYPPGTYRQGRRGEVSPWSPRAPYFVQRYGRLGRIGPLYEDDLSPMEERGRVYKITKKKANKKKIEVEDEPEDEEEQDEIEEEPEDDVEDEVDEPNDDEDVGDVDMSIPLPWEKLFPKQHQLPRGKQGQSQGGGPQGGYSSGPPSEGGPSGGYSSGPPSEGGDQYGGGPPGDGYPGGYRRSLNNIDQELYQPGPPRRSLRYRNVPWEEEDEYEYPVQNRRRSSYPIYRNHLDRTGKQVRIITGWSDTVLQDNYNPEYVVNPTLMRLRRRRRYHPSQNIPIQKVPVRSGYYGNPRDVYYGSGGQQWTGGPFEPYVYSHSH